jgi:hypothetical protein
MRKTKLRKRTNKTHKRRVYKRRVHRTCRVKRGGSIITPMVGSLEGEDHKGLGKIVVAGPMGVMSGTAYLQTVRDIDQQGPE